MTGEGDKVNLQLGDAFVVVDEDYATEYCEKKQVRQVALGACHCIAYNLSLSFFKYSVSRRRAHRFLFS
jgi:hypothetical protein